MTDRELLELAAKAAGMDIHANERGLWLATEYETWVEWNPLTDDGDALRLLHDMRLSLDYDKERSHVICADFRCGAPKVVKCDICLPDPYAATRRAIVRAAAEIGRTM